MHGIKKFANCATLCYQLEVSLTRDGLEIVALCSFERRKRNRGRKKIEKEGYTVRDGRGILSLCVIKEGTKEKRGDVRLRTALNTGNLILLGK